MENTEVRQKDILQNDVSDVYQKTLLSVPASVTSFFDNLNDEFDIDSDFITEFIKNFNGSKLDDVTLMESSESSRKKVIALFRDIELDMHEARREYTDVSDFTSCIPVLKMYLEDRPVSDELLNKAYHSVLNMVGKYPKAKAFLDKVNAKKSQIQAYLRRSGDAYKNTIEDIYKHFSSTGILKKTINANQEEEYHLNQDAVIKRPTEIEELMVALSHIVENSKYVNDIDICDWIGQISADAYDIGQAYLEKVNPNDSAMKAAVEACEKVGHLSKDKGDILWENKYTDKLSHYDVTADPYMRIIFNMIKDGKVSKDKTGPIQVVDVNAITSEDILDIYNSTKNALFGLGPKGSTAEDDPVEFDDNFDVRMSQLKPYVDFLYSDELKPVLTQGPARQIITEARKRLAAAYILTKSVHDIFNGNLMKFSGKDTVENEKTVPSVSKFLDKIKANCELFPKSNVDLDFLFNYLTMFSTESAYFPIEQIMHENPNMYTRLCQYRKGCINAHCLNEMDKLIAKNTPVKYIGEEFVKKFKSNQSLKGIAKIDDNCENIELSTMLNPQQFVNVFNAIADGIAYASQEDVNDRVTEYRLWSLLKTVANNTPKKLGDAVKHEFINVAHASEDWKYRRHLALKAGVLVAAKGKAPHFSGNFGTKVNNVNIQDKRNTQILTLFSRYAKGLLFTEANEVLNNQVSVNIVIPYVTRVLNIAMEYNKEFKQKNAAALGCSAKVSTEILDTLSAFLGGYNVR
ncbi:MAG: hypothetical protein J6Q22_22260 [Prevotella sp.]|nr:hypothetical protein [Prevotella sp.]